MADIHDSLTVLPGSLTGKQFDDSPPLLTFKLPADNAFLRSNAEAAVWTSGWF